jgi:hypothetical protein
VSVGSVVHCRREPYDVYIGRPSQWGNPFSHKRGADAFVVGSRDEAIEAYRRWLWKRIEIEGETFVRALAELHGKTLGCWCAPKRCHGEILVAAAAWATRKINA